MASLERDRKIRVCLPPAYNKEHSRAFPVMCLMDGQNLFEDATSYAGAWHIGEKVAHLPADKQLIMVGIDNGEKKRTNDYLPIHRASRVAEGDAYLEFILGWLLTVSNFCSDLSETDQIGRMK